MGLNVRLARSNDSDEVNWRGEKPAREGIMPRRNARSPVGHLTGKAEVRKTSGMDESMKFPEESGVPRSSSGGEAPGSRRGWQDALFAMRQARGSRGKCAVRRTTKTGGRFWAVFLGECPSTSGLGLRRHLFFGGFYHLIYVTVLPMKVNLPWRRSALGRSVVGNGSSSLHLCRQDGLVLTCVTLGSSLRLSRFGFRGPSQVAC